MANTKQMSMQEIVLSYPRLKERLDNRPNDKIKVEKMLKEMAADFSPVVIRSFKKFLDGAVNLLYEGLNFDSTEKLDFRNLVEQNHVVLVPNHQSHADYVAINYLVYKMYKFPLYVAGGINLNIFPIGKLFRKAGCFFIRRSFASDILYKLTLEGYLYYLLYRRKPIEFFFEGGRTRSGKLLPPRFGLYQMLLEAHSFLPSEIKSDLLFIPVSIVHEYVPEQRALSKELEGKKKKKESTGQLVNLYKLFTYQLGSVHVVLGRPIKAQKRSDETIKRDTQNLAFECFRAVGKNLLITPSSLLALILLGNPKTALSFEDIYKQAQAIVEFCGETQVPVGQSLKAHRLKETLIKALGQYQSNKKVSSTATLANIEGESSFFNLRDDARKEILFFKNSILHHFIVPCIIYLAWIQMFKGKINTFEELKDFIAKQRNLLKYEFYLPSMNEFVLKSMSILELCIGRKIKKTADILEFDQQDLYKIISKIGIFGGPLTYIYEGHYTMGLALRALAQFGPKEFKFDDIQKKAKEIFDIEYEIGRAIKHSESNSLPLLRSGLKYFIHQELVVVEGGAHRVDNIDKLQRYINVYEGILKDLHSFNIKAF